MSGFVSAFSFMAAIILLLMVGAGLRSFNDPGVKLVISILLLIGLLAAVGNLGMKARIKSELADHDFRIDRLERRAGIPKSPTPVDKNDVS